MMLARKDQYLVPSTWYRAGGG